MVLKDDLITDAAAVLRRKGAEEELSKMCSKKGRCERPGVSLELNVKRRNDFVKGKMTSGHDEGRVALAVATENDYSKNLISSSLRSISAAFIFSSKCFKDEVPGIGKSHGDLCNNHAILICASEALYFFAVVAENTAVKGSVRAVFGSP